VISPVLPGSRAAPGPPSGPRVRPDRRSGRRPRPAEFGGLDILVNNAGMGDLATIEETSLEDWQRTVGIDQTGVFLGMKTAAAALADSGHGSVVNISSIFGTSGGFGTSRACHAARGAVRTLTKNTAPHWADRGVRVNSVHRDSSTLRSWSRPRAPSSSRR